jgi:hypothetical protein
MGKVWGPDAVAKNAIDGAIGNISVLVESPKKDGLIYAGTDDGLIQVTENGGEPGGKSNVSGRSGKNIRQQDRRLASTT